MQRTAHIGLMVMAETGAMRRAIERVERCALELEQAIADLNRTTITISTVLAKPDAAEREP